MKLLKHEKARIAPSISDVVKHIKYVVDLVGIDHVGIGSDYDGVEIMPTGLENVTKLPFLTKKLIEHGYTIREVRKILGDNFKRILRRSVSKVMSTSTILYKNNLRTEATHTASGQVILTDAPIDNNGKGEAFSPTDLVATALTSCMITIIAIAAEKNNIDVSKTSANVKKIIDFKSQNN